MPRESKPARQQRALEVYRRLRRRYPDARCALNHSNPLELLVATILSAQCTDERVNLVTKDLLARYRTAADYAAASQADLEHAVQSCGFFRNKAKAIRQAAALIVSDFAGQVPDSMDDLLRLPGVARKTANVILGTAFGRNDGIAVDTHVTRLSNRLAFSRQTDPVKIEQDLMSLVPRDEWTMFSHVLIFHGRQTCTARNPNCAGCVVNELCPSAFTFEKIKGK